MEYAKKVEWNKDEVASSTSDRSEGDIRKFEASSAMKLAGGRRMEGERPSDMKLAGSVSYVQTSKSPTVEITKDAIPGKVEESLPVIRQSVRPLHRQPCACKLCTFRITKNNTAQPTVKLETFESHRRLPPDEKSGEKNACNLRESSLSGIEEHNSGNEQKKKKTYRRTRPEDKRYACTLCPFKAATSTNYKRHFRSVHLDEKPYACNLCDYRTIDKGNLKKHVDARHYAIRRYGCSQCDYKAGDPSTLRTHMRVHSGDRPFACDLCRHRSKTLSNLKKHRTTHGRNSHFLDTMLQD